MPIFGVTTPMSTGFMTLGAVCEHMPVCPHCENDLTKWAKRLERAPAASSPKVWTCPECDVVLGISDYQH